MRVAVIHTFGASGKEPLGEMLDRIHRSFLDSGLGEPAIRFNFGDSPLARGISSVDRVLKRHPDLERFVTSAPPMQGIPGARRISNGPMSSGAGETIPYSTLRAIAAGVPRSFPFHSMVFHLHLPEFGDLVPTPMNSASMMAGILLSDSWWVNGRNRSLSACTVVEADLSAKKIPPPPAPIPAILAACGKVRRTVQAPLADKGASDLVGVRLPVGSVIPSAKPEALRAVQGVVADYRSRLKEIIERANLPHKLPTSVEALKATPLGITAGPRKPALDLHFKPMGYSCKGESGSFDLRRRTSSNLTLEIHLDVGTWGHQVIGFFRVWGLGFKAGLPLPVSEDAVMPSQYPIGDAEHWEQIVANLAAVVKEYEKNFVPAVEAAAGPTPEWYHPQQ